MTELPAPVARQLELASDRVRRIVERLCDSGAARRLAALEALSLSEGTEPHEDFDELIDPVLALATSRAYPDAPALLSRLSDLLARIDDPPRSIAAGAGTAAQRRAFDRVMAQRRALLRTVHRAKDPRSARLAASLLAREPANDAAIEPLLVALIGGASADEDEAAPLLYALARVQASRGATLHRRVASALERDGALGRAACMALAEHAPPEPMRSRIAAALATARELLAKGPLADPRSYGRLLEVTTLDAAIARVTTD